MLLYARLRGLDEASVNRVTEWGLRKLGLAAYSDRYIERQGFIRLKSGALGSWA